MSTAGASPSPGRAYRGTYRGLVGGRASVELKDFGTIKAEQRLNYPARVGSVALVVWRDRQWSLVQVYQ